MQVMAEVLENEFRNAFEVKDPDSLHRGISILVESIPQKEQNKTEHDHFREAMLKMDAKMDATLVRMDEGFKRMDARFEAMQKQMDERFQAVDARFEAMQKQMDERFQAVDSRFDAMQKQMDERFTATDRRFDDMNRRFDAQYKFTTIGFALIGILMSVYQFLT